MYYDNSSFKKSFEPFIPPACGILLSSTHPWRKMAYIFHPCTANLSKLSLLLLSCKTKLPRETNRQTDKLTHRERENLFGGFVHGGLSSGGRAHGDEAIALRGPGLAVGQHNGFCDLWTERKREVIDSSMVCLFVSTYIQLPLRPADRQTEREPSWFR